jgi:hypothetical protein
MSDPDLVIEILSQIRIAVERILRRFEPVDSIDYFLDSEEGLEKLDLEGYRGTNLDFWRAENDCD